MEFKIYSILLYHLIEILWIGKHDIFLLFNNPIGLNSIDI